MKIINFERIFEKKNYRFFWTGPEPAQPFWFEWKVRKLSIVHFTKQWRLRQMTQKKKEKHKKEEDEADMAVVVLSLIVAQSGDVVASGGASSFFLFCVSVFFLLCVFLYLFHFVFALVFLMFFFHSPLCVYFILFFLPLVFFSISHQFSPLCSSLLFSSLFPFFQLPSPPLFPLPKLSCSFPSL